MRFALALAFSLLAAPAFAQTHPCDITSPASVTRKSPVTAGVCWSQKNTDGTSAGVPTALKVFINNTLVKTVVNPVPTGPANAAGLVYFQVPGIVITTQGTKTLTFVIATAEAGDSASSSAYSFVIAVTGTPQTARIE